jgi:hypothetical protein
LNLSTAKQLLPKQLKKSIKYFLLKRKFKAWEKKDRPFPIPHKIKQAQILAYRKKFGLPIFIETGTFLGEMVSALSPFFTKIYSIELSAELALNARNHFQNYHHIQIVAGDSSVELIPILRKVNQPCLFWLDGHYSGGNTVKGNKVCPVLEELAAITKHANIKSVILIDDARLFIGTNDYPTIPFLDNWVHKNMSNHQLTTENDMIIILPCLACLAT